MFKLEKLIKMNFLRKSKTKKSEKLISSETQSKYVKLKESINNSAGLIGLSIMSNQDTKNVIMELNEIISLIQSNDLLSDEDLYRQYLLHRANANIEINNYESALNDYNTVRQLVKKNEQDFNLHKLKSLEGISWCLARIGRYKESLDVCNEIIAYAYEKDQLINKFFVVRGACYKELGDEELAQKSFQLANLNVSNLKEFIRVNGDESLD